MSRNHNHLNQNLNIQQFDPSNKKLEPLHTNASIQAFLMCQQSFAASFYQQDLNSAKDFIYKYCRYEKNADFGTRCLQTVYTESYGLTQNKMFKLLNLLRYSATIIRQRGRLKKETKLTSLNPSISRYVVPIFHSVLINSESVHGRRRHLILDRQLCLVLIEFFEKTSFILKVNHFVVMLSCLLFILSLQIASWLLYASHRFAPHFSTSGIISCITGLAMAYFSQIKRSKQNMKSSIMLNAIRNTQSKKLRCGFQGQLISGNGRISLKKKANKVNYMFFERF